MDVAAWEERDHFIEHVLEEGEGRLLDVVEIAVHAPVRRNHTRRLLGRRKLRIRDDCGAGVSRHLDLRHDGDAALRGIGHEMAHSFLCVDAADHVWLTRMRIDVAPRCGARGNAPPADLGQLRILPDLEPPRLVIGQMPLQRVELVQSHGIDEALDELWRLKMPRRVKHEPSPCETRRVADLHCRQTDRI